MPDSNESIVQIVQSLIREGHSEQQIISDLRDLGVAPDKAKKIIVLAQADVLPLLQAEINRIVDKKVEDKKPEIVHHVQSEIQLTEEKAAQEIKDKNLQELKDFEKYMETKFAIVQSQVNESVRKSLESTDRLRDKVLMEENRLVNLEVGVKENREMPVISHKTANIILAGLGILFAIATAFIFYQSTVSGSVLSTETLIIGVILGLISVTILFVSTLI